MTAKSTASANSTNGRPDPVAVTKQSNRSIHAGLDLRELAKQPGITIISRHTPPKE